MRSLRVKLVLALLAVGLIAASVATAVMGAVTLWGFERFRVAESREQLAAQLADHYRAEGSWAGVKRRFRFRVPATGTRLAPFAVVDGEGSVLLGGLGHSIGDRLSEKELSRAVPIRVDGQVMGMLVLGTKPSALSGPAVRFLGRVNRALVISGLGAMAIAVVAGVLLARSLTGPLRELTAATRAMAQGTLGQRVSVRSPDELGELAASFNQMSAQLDQSQALRRQMTADVAHELRTPLSIVLGHVEALRDGVLPLTQETFDIVHDEVQRLNRLVRDLHTLSLAEAKELPLELGPVSPHSVLADVAATHAVRVQQKGISLEVQAGPDLRDIHVDYDRMAQVLHNLLDNAIRYTASGGRIILSAAEVPGAIRVSVRDSGPGIAPEELEQVFERLYRGDRSRHRGEGGSGLGLAIAKAIVEGHGGRIWAESEPGKGATFIVELPVAGWADGQRR